MMMMMILKMMLRMTFFPRIVHPFLPPTRQFFDKYRFWTPWEFVGIHCNNPSKVDCTPNCLDGGEWPCHGHTRHRSQSVGIVVVLLLVVGAVDDVDDEANFVAAVVIVARGVLLLVLRLQLLPFSVTGVVVVVAIAM
jgi:hypothetical protein